MKTSSARTFGILDLFSGAGGMSLGFEAEGGRAIGAVDIDAASAETFRQMFRRDDPVVFGGPEQGDVNQLEIPRLLDALREPPDLIIGGPPCQGFSRVGRAKQASLLDGASRTRHGVRQPERNDLYRYFLGVVAECRPLAFVMENVPGMRGALGVDVAGRMAREASHLGYNVRYFLLNAAWYGVPQKRWRIFFVGIRSNLGVGAIPKPPIRTHRSQHLPLEGLAIPEDSWMVWGPEIPAVDQQLPAVTVREALGDLPRLVGHLKGEKPQDARLPLRRKPSRWARDLRCWPGRVAPETVSDSWYRFNERDFAIFREMAHGDRYPQALVIANRLLREELERLKKAGKAPKPGSKRYDTIKRQFVPPYRNDAFDEKWRKLIPDEPSWTLTAHLSRDTYSHIHYQSSQARAITVREAARLQSFPDAFEFTGNFGDRFRQIGNAVPPLMARALARQLFSQLDELLQVSSIDTASRLALTVAASA